MVALSSHSNLFPLFIVLTIVLCDKNLCRFFGAPACRVFPDHLTMSYVGILGKETRRKRSAPALPPNETPHHNDARPRRRRISLERLVHEAAMPVVPLVGSRVRVWWTEEEAWFGGRVVSVEPSAGGSLHTTVAYDDDSTETHELESETWEAEEPPSSSSTTAQSLADQREGEAYAAADSVGDELLQQHVRVHWTCERRWFRGTCDATCHENGRRLHHISCTPQLVRTLG